MCSRGSFFHFPGYLLWWQPTSISRIWSERKRKCFHTRRETWSSLIGPKSGFMFQTTVEERFATCNFGFIKLKSQRAWIKWVRCESTFSLCQSEYLHKDCQWIKKASLKMTFFTCLLIRCLISHYWISFHRCDISQSLFQGQNVHMFQ